MQQFWVALPGGKPRGPATVEQLREALAKGRIPPHAMVCPVGEKAWVAIHKVVGAAAGVRVPTPPPLNVPVSKAPETRPEFYTPYEPSGRSGPFGWFLPLCGFVVAIVIGAVIGALGYGLGDATGVRSALVPLVLFGGFGLMFSALASVSLGGIIRWLAMIWKVRSRGRLTGTGLLAGASLLYFSWVSFLATFVRMKHGAPWLEAWFHFACSPIGSAQVALRQILPGDLLVINLEAEGGRLGDVIKLINKLLQHNGARRLGSYRMSSVPLLIGWIIEIFSLALPAAFLASGAAGRPFSERSDRWFDETELQRPFLLPGTDAATASTVDPRALSGLVPGDPAAPHLAIKLYTLPDDPAQALVAVERRVPKPNKKAKSGDKIEYEHKQILAAHWIPGDLAQQLMALKA